MRMNLEYYRIFYYVANHNSITAAAKELNISQPAVSQTLKLLESGLSVSLFTRTPKGVKLTQEGEVLYSYIKRGYETILLGETTIEKMLNLEYGEIRIGASDMTLQYYLLPHLERFHERYPKIKVKVTNVPTPETLEYLKDGKIDFGVVSEPLLEDEDIQVTRVKEIRDVFVAGSRFSKYKDKVIPLSDLEKQPIICLEQNTSSRTYVNEFLKKNGVVLTPEFELATSNMIVQFAIRNLGIGLVVESFATELLQTGELFEVQLNPPIPKRNFCIVQDKKQSLSSVALSLLKMMDCIE